MDNQHRQIKGYRELSQAEVDLMNEIKEHAEKTRDLVHRVGTLAEEEGRKPLPEGDGPHMVTTEPLRWVSIGRDHLQQGYMALTRAVAQPTSF